MGEIAWHIGDGRVIWFKRLGAPGVDSLFDEMMHRRVSSAFADSASQIEDWLNRTWSMVEATLALWTVDDLAEAYQHEYHGVTYAVSRQWTIFRILAHDMHHGGQITELLAAQSVFPKELTMFGGHIIDPPVAK